MTTAANFLQTYAKGFGAGAFATPTGKELAANPDSVVEWTDDQHRTVAVAKTLTRNSVRKDWTGREFTLPAGARMITHIGRTPGAPVPDLSAYDYLFTYREDHELGQALEQAGRPIVAMRVTAAAELIACWGMPGDTARRYPAHDLATVTPIPLRVEGAPTQERMLAEVRAVSEWDDDFPYYSDGSWSAVSLRGFDPGDPRVGVKPSEMPKSWKAEHPEMLDATCEWTVLGDRLPAIREWVEAVPWWGRLERLRLLQMSGRNGKGGNLGRHTDIGDKDGGTLDGQVVRFHIPLITHPDIKMLSWDLTGARAATHLEQWQCYYLDARKPHAVTNPTGVDRVHLVADVIVDPAVRQKIADAA